MAFLLLDSLGSPDRSNKVGIDGPKISVSSIPVRNPSLAKASDRFAISLMSLQYI